MDLISFLNELRGRFPISSPDAFREILSDAVGKNFKIHVERDAPLARAIIAKQYSKGDFSIEFTHQCDGIVLDSNGRVYVVPLPRYNPHPNMAQVTSALAAGKYTVQQVYDGSIVTLYYYNSAWIIASASGYDVSGSKWIGDKTYREILDELLPAGFFDTLSTSKCYTIGFRHPLFQPLSTDPAKVWFMRAVDLDAINCDAPRLVFDMTPPAGLNIIPVEPITDMEAIISKNNTALTDFFSIRISPPHHYGYILRGDFSELGESANILLESSMLETIRKIFYNNTKKIGDIKLNNENRIPHIALRAYLNRRQKYEFIQLFPQFADQYKLFDGLFKEITDKVFSALLQLDSKKRLESFRRTPRDFRRYGIIMEVAQHVLKNFDSKRAHARGGFNAREQDAKSIVADYILDPRAFTYYCNTLLRIDATQQEFLTVTDPTQQEDAHAASQDASAAPQDASTTPQDACANTPAEPALAASAEIQPPPRQRPARPQAKPRPRSRDDPQGERGPQRNTRGYTERPNDHSSPRGERANHRIVNRDHAVNRMSDRANDHPASRPYVAPGARRTGTRDNDNTLHGDMWHSRADRNNDRSDRNNDRPDRNNDRRQSGTRTPRTGNRDQ